MKYRKFGKLDFEVSLLGFGAMRMPVINNEQGNLDEAESIRMIRHAIDQGVNYLDTAYPYHMGASEPLVGRALRDGYRDKVKLATKLPSWLVEKADDFDKYLNEQLERLQTGHIDFYLLHGMNKDRWPKMKSLGIMERAEAAIADGRIRHIGFSFHDDLEAFKTVVDGYDKWDFCQIQYNYMDIEFQAGTEGLKYAADKGLAVVVMEPLRGGSLTKQPPDEVADIWSRASTKRTPADWALQWCWDQPEVATILSGMSTFEQLEKNLASADAFEEGKFSAADSDLVAKVREAYQRLSPVPCTDCKYCMPCPNGVNIPRCFALYNDSFMYDDTRVARFFYQEQTPAEARADRCAECHECEPLCPQSIEIAEWLKKVHDWLGPKVG